MKPLPSRFPALLARFEAGLEKTLFRYRPDHGSESWILDPAVRWGGARLSEA